MKKVDLTLKPGSRTYITGSSGSGKSTFALKCIEKCPSPLVILNTKFDPHLHDFAEHHGIQIVEEMPDWRKLKESVLIEPSPRWISNPLAIDKWLGEAFYCKYIPTIYVDEGYQVGATSNRLGEGVSGLWTRGRALGFRVMIGTQRPKFISRFVLTESDTLYTGYLRTADDRDYLSKEYGEPYLKNEIERYHFLKVVPGEKIQLINPVDMRTYWDYCRLDENEIVVESLVKRKKEKSFFEKLKGVFNV